MANLVHGQTVLTSTPSWEQTVSQTQQNATYNFATGGNYVDQDITLKVSAKDGSVSVADDTKQQSKPTITLDETTGLITADVAATSLVVNPNVSEGWVKNGTSGTVSMTANSDTKQLEVQAEATIEAGLTKKTAVPASKFTTGEVSVAALSVPDPAQIRAGNEVKSGATTIVSGSMLNSTLSNAGAEGVEYAENAEQATVIPAQGALYISEGYIPNTKITLAHMIPDPATGQANPGVSEIRAGYTAFDGDGKQIDGTMPDVAPTFVGGAPSVVETSNTIDTNMETATTGAYYIDASANAKASRTEVKYENTEIGYLNVASGATVSIAATSDNAEINAERVYIPTGTTTVSGGSLSKGIATGGNITGGELFAGTGSCAYKEDSGIGSDGSSVLNSSGIWVEFEGSGVVGRTQINKTAFSQTITASAVQESRTAGYIPAQENTEVISERSETVSIAGESIAADAASSNVASARYYINGVTLPAAKQFRITTNNSVFTFTSDADGNVVLS